MSICVDGPALEGSDATQSINVWLSDSELPSMHVMLTLLFEILTFLFGWGKKINPSTNKCVCFAFITLQMPPFCPLQSRATTSYCWATRLISLVAHWATTFQSNLASPVAERVSGRNNILKALAGTRSWGTSWGQQKTPLLMTYKAVGRSIINYAAPVWSPNLHDTNYRKIQYTQNKALRIATGCHKMSSIDHLHTEAEMLWQREYQVGTTSLRPWQVLHGDNKKTHY